MGCETKCIGVNRIPMRIVRTDQGLTPSSHHLTIIILRNNTWHTSEHVLGRASKNNNYLSYNNQIPEVRQTFLWQKNTGIFTQTGGHPIHLVRVFHLTLSVQSVLGDNHDHRTMEKQRLPELFLHSGQWPQQGHQYSHDKKSCFLHNTINMNDLQHTRTRQHRATKAEPKKTTTITYNFLHLATTLKWSPQK